MPSSTTLVRRETTDQVVTITLDRPPLNILTLALMRELEALLTDAADDPHLKALVLRATGNAFCAGVDVADHSPACVGDMIHGFDTLFARLRTFPAPTIALVHGAALGGGMELALGCDIVLAGSSARLGQPEIKLGVFPPIAAALLPQRIGYARAARLIFTGETLAASEAERIGLITSVVPDDELGAQLDGMLSQLRNLSAAALRLAKRALLTGAEMGMPRALAPVERLYLGELMCTADAVEGIAAFMEKRSPVWLDE